MSYLNNNGESHDRFGKLNTIFVTHFSDPHINGVNQFVLCGDHIIIIQPFYTTQKISNNSPMLMFPFILNFLETRIKPIPNISIQLFTAGT